jgi:hypothetical protein
LQGEVLTAFTRGGTGMAPTILRANERELIADVRRTCGPVPTRDILEPDGPSVRWGAGFTVPEPDYVYFPSAMGLAEPGRDPRLRYAKWRYMGERAQLILVPSRCGPSAARLQAKVATAAPAILTVTAGSRRYVLETSPAGALLDIPVDLGAPDPVATLQTRAPRASPVGAPRFRREYKDEIDNRAAVVDPRLIEATGEKS